MAKVSSERLGDLLRLAELANEKTARELRLKALHQERLAEQMAALDPPVFSGDETYDIYAASGYAHAWQKWLHQERRRISILTARAKLAMEAARRSHAKTTARRQVVERLQRNAQKRR